MWTVFLTLNYQKIYFFNYSFFTHFFLLLLLSLQSCPTLCDPIDGSPPGSLIPGILQARTLEWVAISFSNAGKWKVKVKSLGRVRPLVTPWTSAFQAPPSMGFSRQEYWSGVPLPSLHFFLICPNFFPGLFTFAKIIDFCIPWCGILNSLTSAAD